MIYQLPIFRRCFPFFPGLLGRVVSSVDQEGSSFESFFNLRTWQSTSIGDSVLSGVAYYSQIFTWLVVWNIFYFSIQLGMSSSQLTNSYFSRWLKPPTSHCPGMMQPIMAGTLGLNRALTCGR